VSPSLLIADPDVEPDDPTTLAMRAIGLEIAGICRSASDVAAAAAQVRPDVALVARHLPGDGFVAIDHLLEARPDVIVVLRCSDLDDGDLVTALRVGVRGILPTHLDLRSLSSSMLAALRGEAIIPRETSPRVLSPHQQREASKRAAAETALTPREWEVLELLAAGASTTEIAEALAVAQGTIRTHISTLRRKLGVSSRQDAAATQLA
jgi:DNA-binding NarL/FixJ family response regulator